MQKTPFEILGKYCLKYGYGFKSSHTNAYIATPIGVWRVRYLEDGVLGLMHHNFLKGCGCIENAKPNHLYESSYYHYQHDKRIFTSPDALIMYIMRHDTSRRLEKQGVKYMPAATRKQKKWKKQADNRRRRREIRRLEHIFARLGKEKTDEHLRNGNGSTSGL